MNTLLVKSTLVAGLLFSLASLADDKMSSCLEANAGKADKTTLCNQQQLQTAIDARNKDLDQQYEKAKADLKKQQEDLSKKLPPAPAQPATKTAAPSTDTSPNGTTTDPKATTTTTEGSDKKVTEDATTKTDKSDDSTTSKTDQSETEADAETLETPALSPSKLKQPPVEKKSTGIQWY
jgi:hypothetical protein